MDTLTGAHKTKDPEYGYEVTVLYRLTGDGVQIVGIRDALGKSIWSDITSRTIQIFKNEIKEKYK